MLVKKEDWKPQGVDRLEDNAMNALKETNQSILVTAGAGAGKTEFLAQKATYLLQTGICTAPKRILAISFKKDAACNLAERVRKRCTDEQANRFDSFTFDGFTKSLLDRFIDAVPEKWRPTRNYQIFFSSNDIYKDFLLRNNEQNVQVDKLKKHLNSKTLPFEEKKLIYKYWKECYDAERTLLTFSMINHLVDYMLRENVAVRKALQQTYPIIFLDEFQDTTDAQFRLLDTAFQSSDAIFTAVGDDKQRIMGFAGAMQDAFKNFEERYNAQCFSLLSNWRSHEYLVKIQYAIAHQLDSNVKEPIAQGECTVISSDSAAVLCFKNDEQQANYIAKFIKKEVEAGDILPHDFALLVNKLANNAENDLKNIFFENGLCLRNLAREIGDIDKISLQDIINEEFTHLFLPILRLGATDKSSQDWQLSLKYIYAIRMIDWDDHVAQQKINTNFSNFICDLRKKMGSLVINSDNIKQIINEIENFLSTEYIKGYYSAYNREKDYIRVRDGFVNLMIECTENAEKWVDVLDSFEGKNQVPLMTIHKSKGLEFHTIIFYGLDNSTWSYFKPDSKDDMRMFFVAFTRAKQRAFFTLSNNRGKNIEWLRKILEPAGVKYENF